MLLDQETNVDFKDYPLEALQFSQRESDFRQALADAGVSKYNELADLMIEQNQVGIDFLANNKDFNVLKEETKQILLNSALDNAIANHLIDWTPAEPVYTTEALSCREQYIKDRKRCGDNGLRNIVFVGTACWLTTPVGCAIGMAAILADGVQCSLNAKEDYADCIRK
ncbi:MAG: hypothetical protein ACO1N9_07880 [Flavobacterium sp.]